MDSAFTGGTTDNKGIIDRGAVTMRRRASTCVTVPRLPCLPSTRLTNENKRLRSLACSHVRHVSAARCVFSLGS